MIEAGLSMAEDLRRATHSLNAGLKNGSRASRPSSIFRSIEDRDACTTDSTRPGDRFER
jgi:hypothetical protein